MPVANNSYKAFERVALGSTITEGQREYIKMYLLVDNYLDKRLDKVATSHSLTALHLRRVVDGRVAMTRHTAPAVRALLSLSAERCNRYLAEGGLQTHFDLCRLLGVKPARLWIPSAATLGANLLI